MLFHGWLGLAIWIALGFLLESLMAYKAPSYLGDPHRRELFRLAHAHGTLLHGLLVLVAICGGRELVRVTRPTRFASRCGAIVMPIGFLLAGLWHPEGDPGLFIWLVPAGAVMIIFAAFSLVTAVYAERSARKKKK